jgi:hypothetical protein
MCCTPSHASWTEGLTRFPARLFTGVVATSRYSSKLRSAHKREAGDTKC